MIAKIIVSPILEQRSSQITQILLENNLPNPHPDLLFIDDEEKLGVEQTKKIREFLSIKPYQSPGRGVVLISAQNLTLDAQNSLLKTLEEPPEEAVILLGVEKEDDLLPTILSRCEVVRIKNDELGITEENKLSLDIEKLINSNIEERFNFIEKLEEKEEFLNGLLQYFHTQLKKNPKDPHTASFTKKILEAEKWQKSNVNSRAILEYLMLELP